MHLQSQIIRSLTKLRFRLFDLATIKDISGEKFEVLLRTLEEDGWLVDSKYDGFDAGIDYDCLCLRRGRTKLKCEWDNWNEWSIEGNRQFIDGIAIRSGLVVTYAWRWTS